MATLSGNTIQSTYQGLLKLADSTTGITNTIQTVQDGLGNDVGGVEVNDETFKTTSNYYQPFFKMTYGGGSGISNGNFTPGTNVITSITRRFTGYYYDLGVNSYSAMTFVVNTLGAGTEVYNFAVYDAKLHPTFGLVPNNRLTDVYNIPSTSPLGLLTIPFNSPLKFDGGVYFVMFQTWGAGNTTGTFRLRGAGNTLGPSYNYGNMLGFTQDTTATGGAVRFFSPFGNNSGVSPNFPIYDGLDFPLVCTDGDLTTTRITGVTYQGTSLGFLLHTIF